MKTKEIMERLATIDIVDVAMMVSEGRSYREVSERFGASTQWVRSRMRELGIQGGKPWKRSKRQYDEEKAKQRWRLMMPW